MKKKFLALFCALTMILGIMPSTFVFAEGETPMYAVSGNIAVKSNDDYVNVFTNLQTLSILPRFSERNERAAYSYLDGSSANADPSTRKLSMANPSQETLIKGQNQITLWDLGDVYQIDRVDAISVSEGLASMKVSVSADNVTYTDYDNFVSEAAAGEYSGSTLYVNAVTFDAPLKARYVKIDARMSNADGVMSIVSIWSGLQRITEFWNEYHQAEEVLNQGGFADETTLRSALDSAKAVIEGSQTLDDAVVASQIESVQNAFRGLTKNNTVTMNVLSGNSLESNAEDMYRNLLGENINYVSTGATYSVTEGTVQPENESDIQGGNLLSSAAKPWVEGKTSIVYDLQESRNVNRVDVWARETYDAYYEYRGIQDISVQTSADNENWSDVNAKLNTVHNAADEVVYWSASFSEVSARYVKVTLTNNESRYAWHIGNILVMQGVDMSQYNKALSKAKSLIATGKYTQDTVSALQTAVNVAESAISSSSTQSAVDAQTTAVTIKTLELVAEDAYTKSMSVLSGNVFTSGTSDADWRFYNNRFDYNLVSVDTGAAYRWIYPDMNGRDSDNKKMQTTGMINMGTGEVQADNGWTPGSSVIQYDLKDVYSINEVDIITNKGTWYCGYKTAKVEVSTDDTDDTVEGQEKTWITVAEGALNDNKGTPRVDYNVNNTVDNAVVQQVKFAPADARYVRVTVDLGGYYQTLFSSFVIMSDKTAVDMLWNKVVEEAEALIPDSTYTQETRDNLSAVLADAKNSVAANGSDGNISEQTAKVKAAINNLFYAKTKKKVLLSSNKLTDDDKNAYRNWFGYDIQDVGNNATYEYSDRSVLDDNVDTDNTKLTGGNLVDGTSAGAVFGRWDGGSIVATFNLNGTYDIDEVHLYSKSSAWWMGYSSLKVEYLPADSDQWTEITTADFDNEKYRDDASTCLNVVKFNAVSARQVRLTVNKPNHHQAVLQEVLLLGSTADDDVMITNIGYEDDDANAITSLAGVANVYVMPTVYNNTSDTLSNIKIISAVYRNGLLVKVVMTDSFTLAAGASTSKELALMGLTNMDGTEIIKTFIWNDMTPLLNKPAVFPSAQ